MNLLQQQRPNQKLSNIELALLFLFFCFVLFCFALLCFFLTIPIGNAAKQQDTVTLGKH